MQLEMHHDLESRDSHKIGRNLFRGAVVFFRTIGGEKCSKQYKLGILFGLRLGSDIRERHRQHQLSREMKIRLYAQFQEVSIAGKRYY